MVIGYSYPFPALRLWHVRDLVHVDDHDISIFLLSYFHITGIILILARFYVAEYHVKEKVCWIIVLLYLIA